MSLCLFLDVSLASHLAEDFVFCVVAAGGEEHNFDCRLPSLQGSQGSSTSLSSAKVSSSVEDGDGAVNEGEEGPERSVNLPPVGGGCRYLIQDV